MNADDIRSLNAPVERAKEAGMTIALNESIELRKGSATLFIFKNVETARAFVDGYLVGKQGASRPDGRIYTQGPPGCYAVEAGDAYGCHTADGRPCVFYRREVHRCAYRGQLCCTQGVRADGLGVVFMRNEA